MEALIDKDIRELLPEFTALLAAAEQEKGAMRAQEIKLFHKKTGNLQILLASAIAETVLGGRLLAMSSPLMISVSWPPPSGKARGPEVARQIAHEIKNPLTPIQLSAERLRRRFSDDVADEGQRGFTLCLDTIRPPG